MQPLRNKESMGVFSRRSKSSAVSRGAFLALVTSQNRHVRCSPHRLVNNSFDCLFYISVYDRGVKLYEYPERSNFNENILSDPYDHCRVLPHRCRPRCAGPGIGRGALRRADGVCCAGVCERAESLLLADVLQLCPADG